MLASQTTFAPSTTVAMIVSTKMHVLLDHILFITAKVHPLLKLKMQPLRRDAR